MDDDRQKILEYITQDAIEDLWGIGYTVVRRATGDPFDVPPLMVPHGRKYQWWHLVHDKPHFHRQKDAVPSGWAPVPASRHDGYFMPFGHVGDIEVGGLGLFEKSKFEVDQELAANTAAAHKQVPDWAKKTGAEFSGAIRVGTSEADSGITRIGDPELSETVYAVPATKTIETTVKIPKDMIPHMAAIFEERDRLRENLVLPDRSLKSGDIADKFYDAINADKAAPWWPTLNAILLPIAVENVRATLRTGEPNSDVNVHPNRKEKP